ncbi:hypothetical protein DV515_00009590 [Chloebia gouldiae]|uniref:Uncharacterized protein n=1 Tax=Chloebia gouldiae TaxID=44316 RepID=A0A3L8SCI1_CHLGU|nr:hypothetical protein DV515_00009590 [Chloebia gouldiae]
MCEILVGPEDRWPLPQRSLPRTDPSEQAGGSSSPPDRENYAKGHLEGLIPVKLCRRIDGGFGSAEGHRSNGLPPRRD